MSAGLLTRFRMLDSAGWRLTWRAPPVLECCGGMEITLSSRQTCFQRSRSTSAGRIPANSMMPAAARHSPWCMSPARRSSREHACTGRAAMRRSLMTGISTPAVGLRSAQPRRMAWEQTALRAARPFRKRRGVRKLPLSHSRQLAASSPRTCRRARPGAVCPSECAALLS